MATYNLTAAELITGLVVVGDSYVYGPAVFFSPAVLNHLAANFVAAEFANGAVVEAAVILGTPKIWTWPGAPPITYTGDRHVRRSGDDYGEALIRLLPQGPAWPRDPDLLLAKVTRGLAQVWGFVDERAADLLERESDPRKTIELLEDWERNWGLPDSCFAEQLSIADRQRMLVFKMTLKGAQSREFFIWAASLVGHEITIREWAPFMCGVSRCGDTRLEWGELFHRGDEEVSGGYPVSGDRVSGGLPVSGGQVTGSGHEYEYRWEIGPPEMRFYWSIRPGQAKLTWFRASSGQAGVDPHLRIGLGTELECLLQRWKPAHTAIVIDYSYLRYGGSMTGTP